MAYHSAGAQWQAGGALIESAVGAVHCQTRSRTPDAYCMHVLVKLFLRLYLPTELWPLYLHLLTTLTSAAVLLHLLHVFLRRRLGLLRLLLLLLV